MSARPEVDRDALGARRARILWRCRRGMLEADLLLEGRVRAVLQELEAAGDRSALDALERLLARPDPQLLALLLGRGEPADAEEARLLRRLGARPGRGP